MSGGWGATAVLGTRHGKERVIAPIVEAQLGLTIDVLDTLDTDREIPRTASFRDTPRAEAVAALAEQRRASFGVASEGACGPHPHLPFVGGRVELDMLVDREGDLELVGLDVTMETNVGAQEVGSVEGARAFPARASFPSHGLIVMPVREGAPLVAGVVKGIVDAHAFDEVVRDALRTHGRAWIEADTRAHLNPARMCSIERATRTLASAALSGCPECGHPRYVVVDRVRGLPCADCGEPTARARAGLDTASPAECAWCNP